jgi:hypothetical protein
MNKIKKIINRIKNNLKGTNMELNSIKVKRPVKVKTIVTDKFKQQAQEELSKEIHLLDVQIMQLELQNRQIHEQISEFTGSFGNQHPEHIQQALAEISGKLQQMSELKNELISQRESISHIALNNIIVTGSLENYVELRPGENIYDKFKEAEILVKDGIIQSIRE